MPATRKINHVSQDQDLNQLKNIFGSSSVSTGSGVSNISSVSAVSPSDKISSSAEMPEFQEDTESSKDEEVVDEHVHDKKIITEEKKEVSDTTVGIRMTTAKKREMKAYFIQHGTTMSQGVLDAFSLLRRLEDKGLIEYKDGLLEISNA